MQAIIERQLVYVGVGTTAQVFHSHCADVEAVKLESGYPKIEGPFDSATVAQTRADELNNAAPQATVTSKETIEDIPNRTA